MRVAAKKRIGGRLGRSFVVGATALMVVATLALPARAEAMATAHFTTSREVLAGTAEREFTIQVNNSEPGPLLGGRSINVVRIDPPISQFTAVNVFPPSGWSGFVAPFSGAIFFEANNGGLAPGASAEFRFSTNVGRPCGDRNHTWSVGVSSNGADTFSGAPATPGESLASVIRALQVLSVDLTSPTGVTDNTVTATQDNVVARTRVQNAGGCALDVTGTLGKASGSSNVTTSPADENPKTIASLGEAAFLFNAAFGSAGDIVLSGDATGSSATGQSADAINGSSNAITVMTKAALSYVGNSLQPRELNPDQTTPAFSINLNKTGAVAIDIDTLNSPFEFGTGGCVYSAGLSSPSSIGGGNVSGQLFQFNAEPVPTCLEDGDYGPTTGFPVEDENDFSYSLVPTITNNVTLDSLIPIPTPDIDVGQSEVVGEEPATTDGKQISFNGTITDRGSLCGGCTVNDAYLLQYNDVGAEIPGSRIPAEGKLNITNTGGTMSGTYDQSYHPDAHAIRLFVTVSDGAGNTASDVPSAEFADVDNIVPFIVEGRTGGPEGNDRNRIDVTINEPVASAAVLAADFICNGHQVVSATPESGTSARFQKVQLTVVPEVDRDNPPSCLYDPAFPPNDRVGHILDEQEITMVDGIVPPLPELESISGLSRQDDGNFWTNQSAPVFHVISVSAGHTVYVYDDVNNNGEVDLGTDVELGRAQVPAGASVVDVQGSDMGTAEGAHRILIRAEDASFNVGPNTDDILNLDFTAPAFASAVQLDDQVTVTFTENLARGDNRAGNWSLRDGAEEPTQYRVNSVSGSGISRTLTAEENFQSGTTLAQVLYEHFFGTRYQDRAGNDLPNFAGSI